MQKKERERKKEGGKERKREKCLSIFMIVVELTVSSILSDLRTVHTRIVHHGIISLE